MRRFAKLFSLLTIFFFLSSGRAQQIQLTATVNPTGSITLRSTGHSNDTQTLLQGTDVTAIKTPVATNIVSASGTAAFTVLPTRPHTFYRVVGTSALTTISEMSPANGESGVSPTPETVLGFTNPLATNTVIPNANFYAGFGGRKILSRIELSSDRKSATLFYLEPLPGSTRLYGVFDSTGLLDDSGRPIDAEAVWAPVREAAVPSVSSLP
jgi:hypothetical protein